MTNIKERHWLVDIGFLIAGAFCSVAIQTRSIGYGIAAAVIAGLTLYIDKRNVNDEEEMEKEHGSSGV
jgi:hypothetical protein